MITELNIATRYRAQTHRRAKWTILASLTGLIAASVFHLIARGAYPAWKVGVLVAGVVILAFYRFEFRRTDLVSRGEARRELKSQLQK